MLFLKILRGETPSTAESVVATTDPEVIAAAGAALARRLGAGLPPDGEPTDGGDRALKLERDHSKAIKSSEQVGR